MNAWLRPSVAFYPRAAMVRSRCRRAHQTESGFFGVNTGRYRTSAHLLAHATCRLPQTPRRDAVEPHRPMTETDPIPACVDAFDRDNGGGVTAFRSRGGCTLVLTATDAPIARLKPEGPRDGFRVRHWSHRSRWKDVGDMGGLVLSLDEGPRSHCRNRDLLDLDPIRFRTRSSLGQNTLVVACRSL